MHITHYNTLCLVVTLIWRFVDSALDRKLIIIVMPGIILNHALLNNTLTSWVFVSPKSIQFSPSYGKLQIT